MPGNHDQDVWGRLRQDIDTVQSTTGMMDHRLKAAEAQVAKAVSICRVGCNYYVLIFSYDAPLIG